MHKSGIVKPLAVIVAFTAITPLLSTAPSALAREASNNAITATTDVAEGARLIRQITVKDPKGTTRTPSDPTTVHASHGDTVTVKVTIESKDRNSRGFSDFTELVPAVGQLNKEAITYTIDQQPPAKLIEKKWEVQEQSNQIRFRDKDLTNLLLGQKVSVEYTYTVDASSPEPRTTGIMVDGYPDDNTRAMGPNLVVDQPNSTGNFRSLWQGFLRTLSHFFSPLLLLFRS